jgi:nicotinamide mononucleotide transporter
MFLQVFYLILSISGWIYWKKDATDKNQAFKFNLLKISWSLIFIFSASLLIGYIQLQLPKLLPSVFKSAPSYPFWDATIVSLSIYGTFLLARQIRENWIVWMLVNTLATILYGIKEMYFTSILYSIFFILAIIGWIKWKPNLKN